MEPAHGGAGPPQRPQTAAPDAAGGGESLAVPDSSDDESSLWFVQVEPAPMQRNREGGAEGGAEGVDRRST
eukprot:17746-Lingulodinium_polyedra.AAC.1